MIENVLPVEELAAIARRKRKATVSKTVPADQLEAAIADGWKPVGRRRKQGVRVTRPKPAHVLLEDRVWTSLYGMGFQMMSGEGGARLQVDPKDPESPTTQIDVFAMDQDVAVAIECKSAVEPRKEPRFQEEIAKHSAIRDPLTRTVHLQFPSTEPRKIVLASFTSNLKLTENDQKRAQILNVALFDDTDLGYYEALTRQLGQAARYQFLCDLIPNKPVRGLEAVLPALKTTLGGRDCYQFSAHPDYLLKVCYVSHRAKGKASDIDAYQRMVSKSRLSKIRSFISEGGIFPTNIVLSFQDPDRLRFDRGKQELGSDGALFGWLHISPTYKSAWIIDGQHRLFAYSGHPFAQKASLSVLAFAGLPASEQAELFIDINGEQRRVKKNLLEELYAELHWTSTDPHDRIGAIISKAIQVLDEDGESPLYGRILRADESRNPNRCISLTTIFRAMDKNGFYVNKKKRREIVEFGPLWTGDQDTTLRRTCAIVNAWFSPIREKVRDWWEVGSAKGGGLAMNDGVTICINVMRNALLRLREEDDSLIQLSDQELAERIRPYAEALGEHFASLDTGARTAFRALRGAQGQSRGTNLCLAGIKRRIPTFVSAELEEFEKREAAQTTQQARALIDSIETTLQRMIIQELKEEFGGERWWYEGVPEPVRIRVAQRREEDQARRGGNEAYFDLIDYRTIAMHNWSLLGELVGQGKGAKDKRTEWIQKVNEVRKRAMHPSSGGGASFEELEELRGYDHWLQQQLLGADEGEGG